MRLPARSLVYSMRPEKAVNARLPDGKVYILASTATSTMRPFTDRFFEPYGLVYDAAKDGFWLADKGNGRVWFVRIVPNPDWQSGNVLQGEEFYSHPSMQEPCGLDIDSQRGLLIGCFGSCTSHGEVLSLNAGKFTKLTPDTFSDRVTHCCWLPDGGFCYVTRTDSVLWHDAGTGHPRALTAPSFRAGCAPQGRTSNLMLQYIQGLQFSQSRKVVLLGDAGLGAIFGIDLKSERYSTIAGLPRASDSQDIADVRAGPANVWLGRVRGMVQEINGEVVWLDGQKTEFFSVTNGVINNIGPAFHRSHARGIRGVGLASI